VAGEACLILENFIYQKHNALSDEVCDLLVGEGEKISSLATRCSHGYKFGDSNSKAKGKLYRNDFQIYMPQDSAYKFNEIQECIFDGLSEYEHVISSVKQQRLVSPVAKIQHTPIGGGFHDWHCEQEGGGASTRSLVWMIYLNDVDDGGETEFLYQHAKVKPKKGCLVIWPAGITHPHRGNPPYSNEKWVVTGWFEVAMHEVYSHALNALYAMQEKHEQ
jgi:hypothetical protein